jgi:DNA-binding transcriptional ArsR family regulator
MIISVAKKLKVISNENRLQILYLIKDKELSVGKIEENMQLSQSALSQHLAILREYDLVKTRRLSQTIFYQLKDKQIAKLLEFMEQVF